LQAQLSYNQKDSISKKIFDGFEKKYIEESFIIIWNDDTKAINQSRGGLITLLSLIFNWNF
jgi:hypothetical protein